METAKCRSYEVVEPSGPELLQGKEADRFAYEHLRTPEFVLRMLYHLHACKQRGLLEQTN